ncbi:MAG: nucleotidyl transferase AbiEii/AbiGii toxin family protein [Deltaproteobacteria bacterium]|nr:nucleotidyl transferase AbiEii/AbiGii toxin family protein [Deltaproteobacteria bacterium]
MKSLEQHEMFEIETLRFMKNRGLLSPIVFGGGTMLRLCHELNRYSVDLDFYFKKQEAQDSYFKKIGTAFHSHYIVSDYCNKYNTILLEIRHDRFRMKLKIEINKIKRIPSYHTAIAFSPHSTVQVNVDTIPLENMMINKIEALLDRKEIRDAYDIEFMLRRGVHFPADAEKAANILKTIKQFKKNDFNVKLGSLLPPEARQYYRQNRFEYFERYLMSLLV